jgi:uncharacterized membrane protein YedE/YeeE|tara:strand:- start:202 stop:633 length:432 start_codon:yes stop_codon:yes gene_type:complete
VKHLMTVFFSGVVFALGLGVSGMTNANKVIGFLDLSGTWDPSLGFVMVGAIGVHMALYKLILKRKSPVFGERFQLPTRVELDVRLVGGAALFGAGWGLGGFCPGPGIVSAATLGLEVGVFVIAMLGGMWVFQKLNPQIPDQKY